METKRENSIRRELQNARTQGFPINEDFFELVEELLAFKKAMIKKLVITQSEIDSEK